MRRNYRRRIEKGSKNLWRKRWVEMERIIAIDPKYLSFYLSLCSTYRPSVLSRGLSTSLTPYGQSPPPRFPFHGFSASRSRAQVKRNDKIRRFHLLRRFRLPRVFLSRVIFRDCRARCMYMHLHPMEIIPGYIFVSRRIYYFGG